MKNKKTAAMFRLDARIEKQCHTEGRCPWVSRSQIFKYFKLTLLDCRATLAMTKAQTAAMFGLDASGMDFSLIQSVEKQVDGNSTGNVRYAGNGGSETYYIFIKVSPAIN